MRLGSPPSSNEIELAVYDRSQPAPATPKELEILKAKSMSVELSWEAVEDVTGYSIYRANGEQGTYKKIAHTVMAEYTDEQLTPDTKYYYKVSATGVGGESKKSNSVSAKTGPPVVLPDILHPG
ncbi:hypothetical protein ACA29_16440 [Lederbergia galactosidilytica]|uniref:Fibronectin type-III domain-containing protein n=1 Tax=Lederbergia galactosidilytica TaxID=217031 RepID=A0A0Q9Y7A7_9BACI|nr:hypothetical protein ACA29_16440 [Lederbergia galactosidilytica]